MARVALSGCFTLSAATIPYQRLLDEIRIDENRDEVLEAVGQPDSSAIEDGKRVDVFEADPHGPQPGGRPARIGEGLLLDTGMTVYTLGLYPLFIEWGPIPLKFLYDRVKNGGADYDKWSVIYTTDGKVESIRKEVKHSLIWPTGAHDPESPHSRSS
jgi:hypothetical protein